MKKCVVLMNSCMWFLACVHVFFYGNLACFRLTPEEHKKSPQLLCSQFSLPDNPLAENARQLETGELSLLPEA